MAYHVELTARASRDLEHLYRRIQADEAKAAASWFNGLEPVQSRRIHWRRVV